MHIRPIKLLDNSITMADYDLNWRLYRESKGLNWGNDKKVKKVMTTVKDNEDKAKNLSKNRKRLKKEKIRQNRESKVEKVGLKAEKANKNININDNKNASSFASITAFLGFIIPTITSPTTIFSNALFLLLSLPVLLPLLLSLAIFLSLLLFPSVFLPLLLPSPVL